MKYEDKYPDAVPGDTMDRNFYHSEYGPGACFQCGKDTYWIDHSWASVHVCSEECEKTMTDEYIAYEENRGRTSESPVESAP